MKSRCEAVTPIADMRRFTKRPPRPAPSKELICEIRVLETTAELIESYRLRYLVYGALGYLRGRNVARLEIDSYDLSSIPFGAFGENLPMPTPSTAIPERAWSDRTPAAVAGPGTPSTVAL